MTDHAERIRGLIEEEKAWTSSPAAAEVYARNHARRFDMTFDLICRLVADRAATVCDVGRSALTARLAGRFADVSSLGLALAGDSGGHREPEEIQNVPHIVCDLNASADVTAWPREKSRFDLIVFAETIEHLHTPPEFALMMLGSLLKPGGVLLVTTPNAAGLSRRVRLLFGYHPYEKIRYFSYNPGHFREYTRQEMIEMGRTAGLEVRECRTLNFYKSPWPPLNWAKWPPPLRDSTAIVYAAPETRAQGSAAPRR